MKRFSKLVSSVPFLVDDKGVLVGYQDSYGYSRNLVPTKGFSTMLFGDSMTANYNEAKTTNTATYNRYTGVLTLPITNHGLLNGMPVAIYNLAEPGLRDNLDVIVNVVDANNISIQLSPNLNISANIVTTVFITYKHWISSKGWFSWFNIKSGNRFNVVKNSAQDGDTTVNMVTRLERSLNEYRPQVVFMQMPGINDIGAGVGEDTIWANQKTIVDMITSRCLLVCLTTTPVTVAHALGTKVDMARVMALRNKFLAYSSETSNLIVYDALGKVIDSTSAIGAALATYMLPDGIHYSPKGAYVVGTDLWEQTKNFFPGIPSSAIISNADNFVSSSSTITSLSRINNVITAVLASHGLRTGEKVKISGGTSEILNEWVELTSTPSGAFSWNSPGVDGAITGTVIVGKSFNLLPTPLLLVATGGSVTGANNSGVAATNVRTGQGGTYGTGGSIVSSVIANPNGFGNNQQVVVTPGTGSVINPSAYIQVGFTNLILPYVKAGRKYAFRCELTVANISGSTLTELKARLILTIDGQYPEITVLKAADNMLVEMADGSYLLETPYQVLVPGTLTAIQWSVDAKFNGVSAQAVSISVGRLAVMEQE